MAFFDIGLTLAIIIAVAGMVYRVSLWSGQGRSTASKAPAAPFPLLRAIWTLPVEVFGLMRTLRTSPVRWVGHTLIFVGFMGLLLFHALDETITAHLFPAYEPTLDPWQWGRNLLGVMVLAGLGIMVWRRAKSRSLRTISRFQDWAALLMVGGIILSGFFLEASKIMSPAVFDRMVAEYSIYEGGREITALKSHWAREYGVVFPGGLPMDDATLKLGSEVNEDSCIDCHSNTSSAFVSRPLADVLGPIAPAMNISRADEVFWYLHLLFCFVGLAALPFGKFFHPLSTPANLVVRRGRRDGAGEAPALRGLGIDACTRCGECSLRCSVAPSAAALKNEAVLPSEKLSALSAFRAGRLDGESLALFAEGSRTCTLCLRCTDICPAGINLQDLWMSSEPDVAASSPDPNVAVRVMGGSATAEAYGTDDPVPSGDGFADKADSFWACVQCTTCTSVCPVVAVSDDPTRDLDLTPQQIMNLLRMGLKGQTLGARMVWSCTTCYKCQEHCPQNIRVADILYELRNAVAAHRREGGDS